MKFHFSSIGILSRLFSLTAPIFLGASAISLADVCVWRDPERTMTRLFPQAKDYRTIDVKLTDSQRDSIEARLGERLAPGERVDWSYYEISSNGEGPLGYIIADAEKGQYGVIEIVMGIGLNGKVVGVYIQRDREKDKEYKSRELLRQFEGKTVDDSLVIGKDLQINSQSSQARMVAFGVKKMLLFYREIEKKQ